MHMMQAGASAYEVEEALRRRTEKANTLPGHAQYAYDRYYTAARDYIDRKNRAALPEQTSDPAAADDRYAARMEAALDRLETRAPFRYDPEEDPAFQAYRAAYRREGDRAGRNALAEAAALTGGQASTAAVTAASQARDIYNSKVGDVVPELYRLAWQMYQGEQEDLAGEIALLGDLSAAQYQRQADTRAQDYREFADQRDFAYAQQQDVRDRETAAHKQAQSEEAAAADRRDDAADAAYRRAMAFLKEGVMPSDNILRAAGIDRQTARQLRAAALRGR